jgi:hypothetical protein
MRHFRSSRVADRDRATADLLGADGGLEATPIPSVPDEAFSLRPLAASLPGDDVVVADPLREGTEIDHLLRRAREQVSRGRGAEGTVTYRQLIELDPTHRAARVELARLLEGIEDLEGATEQLTSALYLDKHEDVDHYLEVMNHLSTEALTPAQSTKFITEIIRDT